MKNQIILISLFILFPLTLFPQKSGKEMVEPCYPEQVKWNVKESIYRDTVVQFRDCTQGDKERRVLCGGTISDTTMEEAVWERDEVKTYTSHQKRLKSFSFIGIRVTGRGDTVASFYLCKWESSKTVEMVRFKMEKGEVAGVNKFPGMVEEFIPVKELEKDPGFIEP